MLLRCQYLISSFKAFFFIISSSFIHKNLSLPIVSFQKIEKISEACQTKIIMYFPHNAVKTTFFINHCPEDGSSFWMAGFVNTKLGK